MARAHAVKPGLLAGATQGIGNHIERAWAAYWSARARRATVLMLQSLDGRTLKDIGIDRSEIESVVYGEPDDRRR
jgi:uncharacterized protein YjiS (DUF1127 family)